MHSTKLSAAVNNLFLQGKSVDEISLTVLISVMKRKLEFCNAGRQLDASWQASYAWISANVEGELFGPEIRDGILRTMLNATPAATSIAPGAPALAALVEAVLDVEARCVATGHHRRDQALLTIKTAPSIRRALDVIDVRLSALPSPSEGLVFVPRQIGPLQAMYLKTLTTQEGDDTKKAAWARPFKWHQEREAARLFEAIRTELLGNDRAQEIAFIAASDVEKDIARAFAMALSIAWNLPFPQASASGNPIYLETARRALGAAACP